MRIAIVGPGFTGTTFPLAQHLVEAGHHVDCYYFTVSGKVSIESLDFKSPISIQKIIYEVEKSNSLYRYLNPSINVYVLPVLRRHFKLESYYVGNAIRWTNLARVKIFNKYFFKKNYDRVILIDHSDETHYLAIALKKKGIKFITIYHEVLNNLITGGMRREVIASLSSVDNVVVHCNDIKDIIIKESGISNIVQRLSVIRFGAFESFWQYGEGKGFNGLTPGFLLFMGRITPYKGVRYLYEAIEKLSHVHNLHIVIAGSGNDDVLEKIRNDRRFTLINRFIENDEIAWLTRNCSAIVCPYVAASQSGMIGLSLAYGKPMIATRVGAFPEVIKEGENGYLAEPCDSDSFASAIQRYLNSASVFVFKSTEEMKWGRITKQYITLLERI